MTLPVDLPVPPLETCRLDALESSRHVTLKCVEDVCSFDLKFWTLTSVCLRMFAMTFMTDTPKE